jgi:hypothetical protein
VAKARRFAKVITLCPRAYDDFGLCGNFLPHLLLGGLVAVPTRDKSPGKRLFSKSGHGEKSAIIPSMNSIKQITSGLSSSLFLAVGLTRLAEKTDPMLQQNGAALTSLIGAATCQPCDFPCAFTPETGQ